MTRSLARWSAPLLLSAFVMIGRPASVAAQTEESLTLALTTAWTEVNMSGFGIGDEDHSGLVYGVEGGARFWRVVLEGEYRQGRLSQEHLGGATARSWFARGRLGVYVLPWVVLAAGPSVSTVGGPTGDRQVVRWRLEALGAVPLVPDMIGGYASISGTVAGTNVDQVTPLEGGSAEAGIVFSRSGQPLWARLGYRIEDEYLGPGWGQTVETAFFSIGIRTLRLSGD